MYIQVTLPPREVNKKFYLGNTLYACAQLFNLHGFFQLFN